MPICMPSYYCCLVLLSKNPNVFSGRIEVCTSCHSDVSVGNIFKPQTGATKLHLFQASLIL